jgi:hypothetical protein
MTFAPHDLESLAPEVQLYHCFAAPELWSLLQDMINRNLDHNVPRCEMRELELLLRFIFAIAVYNISPSRALERPEDYPLAADTVEKFVGNGSARILELLKALDPQTTSPDDEEIWREPFAGNEDIQTAEQYVSKKCIRMVFRADSSSTIVIDDDKMRNRAPSAGVELCWARNKSPKTFGPVNNMVASLATNLFIASTMQYRGENCVIRRMSMASI